MLGLGVVANRPGDDGLRLLHRRREGPQRGDGTPDAVRDGIEDRRRLTEARPERDAGGAVPGGAVAQPREDAGEGGEPPRGRLEPVGDLVHAGRVAGKRGQPAHHGPPARLRDTPVSVSR